MKNQADKHRTDFSFKIGDLVLVRLQPYRQHSVHLRTHHKLSKRYYGPYPIIDKIGTVAYKLKLPDSSKIHPVFHISLLKKFYGENSTTSAASLPHQTYHNQPLIQPLAILDTRNKLINHHWEPQVLVLWESLPLEEATWIPVKQFRNTYPNFHLEDKVSPEGVSIDTTKVVNQTSSSATAKSSTTTAAAGEGASVNASVEVPAAEIEEPLTAAEVGMINPDQSQHKQPLHSDEEIITETNNLQWEEDATDQDLADLEDLIILGKLRRSRRNVKEPTWLKGYSRGRKVKASKAGVMKL